MKSKTQEKIQKTLKQSPVEFGVIFVASMLLMATILPSLSVNAYEAADEAVQDIEWETRVAVMKIQNEATPFGDLPEAERAEPRVHSVMTISAYNSVPWQTDATPCIGAQGTDICEIYATGENVCAANFVPLGTILHVDGLGECVVRDRMNARYYYRVDWYMGMDVPAARTFGIQQKQVSIYPSA